MVGQCVYSVFLILFLEPVLVGAGFIVSDFAGLMSRTWNMIIDQEEDFYVMKWWAEVKVRCFVWK